MKPEDSTACDANEVEPGLSAKGHVTYYLIMANPARVIVRGLAWLWYTAHHSPSPFPVGNHHTLPQFYSLIHTAVESSSCRLLAMAAPEAHHLFHNPIADHSFSPDKATLAVARESNVELYQKSGNKFSLTDELKGHEKTVTGVDIAPNSGRIVTCSQGKLSSSPCPAIVPSK